MKRCIEKYIKLSEYAAKDKSLIHNHIRNEVPEKLQKFIDENRYILSLIEGTDKTFEHILIAEITEGERALEVYRT